MVKRSGSNFYYSFFFLPKRRRRAIYAVYAFSRQIDDIADEEGDIASKERLFSFWRSEVEAAYGSGSRHPLTEELLYAIREFKIPKEYLIGHLNGIMQDMVQTRYATFDDLKNYCYRVASLIGLICLKIFGVEDDERNSEAAAALGLAFQLTNILRDISTDADRDRIYIPMEDLSRFNLTEQDILEKRYSENFVNMMSFEWERAHDIFLQARSGFDKRARRKLLPAMVMAGIYYRILMKIRDAGFRVFDGKIGVSIWEKIWIVLKTLCLKKSS